MAGHATRKRRAGGRRTYTCRGRCKPLHKPRAEIAREIKPISQETIKQDFQALCKLGREKSPIHTARILGNRVVDFFTFQERLNTISKHNISFYEFLQDFDFYKRKPYISQFIRKNRANYDAHRTKFIHKIFRFYAGSVQIFKPVQAMEIIRQVGPRVGILDPTMGWGGRLVGACAMAAPKYIGIDSNRALRGPYADMVRFLRENGATTAIDLRFTDALSVDYGALRYDMVIRRRRITTLKNMETWNLSLENQSRMECRILYPPD